MNGSIVYELDRPENTGLKKSLKASSPLLLYLFPFSYVHTHIRLTYDTILSNTSYFLVKFECPNQLTPKWMHCY